MRRRVGLRPRSVSGSSTGAIGSGAADAPGRAENGTATASAMVMNDALACCLARVLLTRERPAPLEPIVIGASWPPRVTVHRPFGRFPWRDSTTQPACAGRHDVSARRTDGADRPQQDFFALRLCTSAGPEWENVGSDLTESVGGRPEGGGFLNALQVARGRLVAPRYLAAVAALVLAASSAAASVAPAASAAPPGNAFGPHKVLFPTQQAWRQHRVHRDAGTALGNGLLTYHGGIDGIGVTTGQPHVYLVFWGSQWGTASTGGDGYTHLTGDPQSIAPRLQAMYSGLGTDGELWSGVMTQYCDGAAIGATSCSASNPHVAYPSSNALAGLWVDTASAAPAQATDNQIATEAVTAAGHFGNTTATSNRDAQYVIASPTGTNPGGFNTPSGQFCAWHDYNGDTTLVGGPAPSNYGDIAFTNLPYLTDAGTSCGAGYVNGSAGALDGVTIVAGHE